MFGKYASIILEKNIHIWTEIVFQENLVSLKHLESFAFSTLFNKQIKERKSDIKMDSEHILKVYFEIKLLRDVPFKHLQHIKS